MSTPPPEETEPYRRADPLGVFSRFHGAIRRRLLELSQLEPGVPIAPRVAQQQLVFFGERLVNHDHDEEASLLVRLRRLGDAIPELERLIDRIAADHDHLESCIDKIRPHLELMAREGTVHDMTRFHAQVALLKARLLPHLRREETELFPLARRLLPPIQLEEIRQETDARAANRRKQRRAAVFLSGEPRRPPGDPKR